MTNKTCQIVTFDSFVYAVGEDVAVYQDQKIPRMCRVTKVYSKGGFSVESTAGYTYRFDCTGRRGKPGSKNFMRVAGPWDSTHDAACIEAVKRKDISRLLSNIDAGKARISSEKLDHALEILRGAYALLPSSTTGE